jgi:peptidoglycan/LPS O-acetylase OafA/YrhL
MVPQKGGMPVSYQLFSKYRSELMGVAMLWVMLFHAADLDFGLTPLNWLRSAGFGGVDIFILLSAMGLFFSLSAQDQSYSTFMARRASRILPAYYIVALPFTLLLIFLGRAGWSALFYNSTLLYYWVGCQGAFNWYVAGIMTFYAVTPLCFRVFSRAKHKTFAVILAIFSSLLLCQLLIREDWWRLMDVFYRIPVFFLGLLLGHFIKEGKKITPPQLFFWFCSLGMGGLYLWASATRWYFPLCHLFLFTTVPLCLILCVIFEKIPGKLLAPLRLVGEHSLEMYLFNVRFFSLTDLWHRVIPIPSPYLFWLILFGLNILLALVLHKGIDLFKCRISCLKSK